MSDFTDSLKRENDDDIKTFVLEFFDRVDTLHSQAKTEFEQAYYQGKKDALRSVLSIMTGSNCDTIGSTSIIGYKLRGDLPLENGEFLNHDTK